MNMDIALDVALAQNIELPPVLTPANPLNGSWSVVQFHMLDDEETGVLVLGSFSASSVELFQESLLTGLKNLKEQGATKLIVDVVRA